MTTTEPFAAVDVIATKRDGGRIPDEQLDWVIDAYTRGVVADEQMAALAMAILLNGMAPDELARWTAAMIASGERLDLSGVSRPTTDKHSTGGVGDKITLPLAPLVAACGAAVPQLSGRGLGHTGGTLDKLESIPGWRAQLSNAEFLAQLRRRRRGRVRRRGRARAGRPQAVRAPRRHRDRRIDPAHREFDHEQEDRRGIGRAGAGRQGRLGRVHEDRRGRSRAGAHDGRLGDRPRDADRRAAHRHVDAAGPYGGQRARGRGVARGTWREAAHRTSWS